MNKKGYVLLFTFAIGFLLGIVYYAYSSKDFYYPGEDAMNLVELHKEEQNVFLFFDESIKMSLRMATKDVGINSDPLLYKKQFESNFEKYLEGFNQTYKEDLTIKDFDFKMEYYPDKIIVNTKCANTITFETDSKFRYEETLGLDFKTVYEY